MTEAHLLTAGDRPAVRLERLLPDPPPTVWLALTEREQLRSWFPCDVAVAGGVWRPGAAITFTFGEEASGMTVAGVVVEVDEPHLLVFSWGEDVLRFELSPHGEGTRLVLVDQVPPDAAARNAAGWDDCLDRLAGTEDGTPDWRTRFAAYAARFEGELGPQAGPPAEVADAQP
jgi:uncharacterized protein YndB with AHSA1/START domain